LTGIIISDYPANDDIISTDHVFVCHNCIC
ncbi:hypothetical protein EZS27_037812, partial [termite gut metagenome]